MSAPGADLDARTIARAVAAGELRATEVVEAALARAEGAAALNAFTLIDAEGALAAARDVDALPPEARRDRPLLGVPFAAKDFTPTAGHLTTRGSFSTGDERGQADPVIIRRLKAAGAVLIGKTTTPEFAYSSFTQSPRWGATRNPHDPAHTPGGSSGGAGAAVAAGVLRLAEGTDMGGSVRIPAALCGVVGLKPGLGRIPMDILPCGSDMLSHFGPLAASVDEAAMFLDAVAGPDPADLLSHVPPDPGPDMPQRRIALSMDLGYYAVHPQVEEALERAAQALRDRGFTVEPVALNWSREINDGWMALWGVAQAANWGDALTHHADRMDPDLVALMRQGQAASALDMHAAQALRHRLWRDLAAVFARFDALILPTCAQPAPRLDQSDADFETDLPDGRFAGLDMCQPFNLVGPCPALSVPVGLAQGLPVGMQIVTPPWHDHRALALGRLVEADAPPIRPA